MLKLGSSFLGAHAGFSYGTCLQADVPQVAAAPPGRHLGSRALLLSGRAASVAAAVPSFVRPSVAQAFLSFWSAMNS